MESSIKEKFKTWRRKAGAIIDRGDIMGCL
jgi:hypothetical protein